VSVTACPMGSAPISQTVLSIAYSRYTNDTRHTRGPQQLVPMCVCGGGRPRPGVPGAPGTPGVPGVPPGLSMTSSSDSTSEYRAVCHCLPCKLFVHVRRRAVH
jgi:hypothetical protein